MEACSVCGMKIKWDERCYVGRFSEVVSMSGENTVWERFFCLKCYEDNRKSLFAQFTFRKRD